MDSIAQIKTNWKQIILDYPHLDSLLHNMKVEKKSIVESIISLVKSSTELKSET